MALRDRVRLEGRGAFGVAAFSVVMWVGIAWIFGLPTVMVWIVAVLLFLGGVLKGGGTTTSETSDTPATPDEPDDPQEKKSLYGPKE